MTSTLLSYQLVKEGRTLDAREVKAVKKAELTAEISKITTSLGAKLDVSEETTEVVRSSQFLFTSYLSADVSDKITETAAAASKAFTKDFKGEYLKQMFYLFSMYYV